MIRSLRYRTITMRSIGQRRGCTTSTTPTSPPSRYVALQTAAASPTPSHLLFKSHSAAMEAARRLAAIPPPTSGEVTSTVDREVCTRALADEFFSGQPATHEGSCGMSDEESVPVKTFLSTHLNDWDCTSGITHVLELGCGTGRFSTHWLDLFPSIDQITLVEPQEHFLSAAVTETAIQAEKRNVMVKGLGVDIESLLTTTATPALMSTSEKGPQSSAPLSLTNLVGGKKDDGDVDLVVIAGVCLYLSDSTIKGVISKALSSGAKVLLLEDFSINYVPALRTPIVGNKDDEDEDASSSIKGVPCFVPVLGDHVRIGADVSSGKGGTHVLASTPSPPPITATVAVSDVEHPLVDKKGAEDGKVAEGADDKDAHLPVELSFIQDGSLVRSKDHFDEIIALAVADATKARKEDDHSPPPTSAPSIVRFNACSDVHPELYSPIGLWLVS